LTTALKSKRPPKKILQSINCFVQFLNVWLKYGTVQLLTNSLFVSLADSKTALPIVTRNCGSPPKAHFWSLLNHFKATPMTSRQTKIQEDTHFRIMRILQENPDLTQRELAEMLGMSVGGLNYCLNALIDKGLVKMQNFSQSKNKFGYVYLLTPRGISEKITLTNKFLERKQAEYEALKAEIESLRAESDISETAQCFEAMRS
jgi:EPS-associated MarR family transcriptional regulator